MEALTSNLSGSVRRVVKDGRKYLVAPMTLIVPGVLSGSQGSLYYPPEEIASNYQAWNGIPLVVYHPEVDGHGASVKDHPEVLEASGIGEVRNARIRKDGALVAEGWFDVEKTKKVDTRIYNNLNKSQKIELSTGLFTDNHPAENGAADSKGRSYTHTARNYRPDHLAILPDQRGACSLQDGCGVLNKSTDNAFCPTGEGGGQDNSCSSQGGPGGKSHWVSEDTLPHDSWKELPGEEGYVYHATNLENAGEIQTSSLDPHKPWYGTDQEAWPDGSTNRRSYFSDKPSTAWSFAPAEGKPVLLRVKQDRYKFKKESTGDIYTRDKIDPSHIEIATKDGWKPLKPATDNQGARPMVKRPTPWYEKVKALGLTLTSNVIRQEGDKYVLYSHDGSKKLGEFGSEEEAKKREAEINYFKHAKNKQKEPQTENKDQAGPNNNSSNGGPDMAKLSEADKKRIVDNLITNCDCGWKEDDRTVLNGMSDEALTKLEAYQKVIVANREKAKQESAVAEAARKGFEDKNGITHVFNAETKTWEHKPKQATTNAQCDPEEEMDENGKPKKKPAQNKQLTREEWLAQAPVEVREDLAFAANARAKEKQQLIDRLTANVEEGKKAAVVNRLKDKSLDELNDLLVLAPPPKQQRQVSYAGAATPATNAASDPTADEVLDYPVVNWARTKDKQ